MSNKFHAKPQTMDGERFASKAELARYRTLKVMLNRGEIHNLTLHPKYSLDVRGLHICDYIADFRYEDGPFQLLVVEDSKSEPTLTAECRIKLRLMEACHGIKVRLTGAIAKRKVWKVRRAR